MQEILDEIASAAGGKITEFGLLSDNSGFAVMSTPLPKDHWLTAEGFNEPPAPFRMGKETAARRMMHEALVAAGRYAVRCATMNGTDNDFDPDALIQNLVVGFLGYHTADGTSNASYLTLDLTDDDALPTA